MTKRTSNFCKTSVCTDPELLAELGQARLARLTLVEVAERVYAELARDKDPLAIPLGLALEQYKHPFILVAHDPVP